MTDLYAGIPVSDWSAGLRWYEAFFGRPADEVIGREALWQVAEHAWLFVDEQPDRAGGALQTLGVADLDAHLSRWAERGVAHEPVETYANGVRHVTAIDPDGNRISLAHTPGE